MEAGIDAGTAATRIALRDGGRVVVRTLGGAEPASLLTAGTGERPAARSRADIPAGMASQLGELPDEIVAAVPDSWLDGSVSGAVAAENFRDVLAAELRMPPRRLVPYSAAAAAAVAEEVPERFLMCDVGAHTLTAALCRREGGGARVDDAESAGGPVVQRAGAGFEGRALRAAQPELSLDPPALKAFRTATERDRRRAVLLLARAATLDRYRDAPAYRIRVGEQTHRLTAADVLSCFAPVREAIRDMISQLLGRNPEAAEVRPQLAIAGGFGGFPLVRDALLAALPAAWRASEPATMVLGTDVVARGALALAENPARAHQPSAHTLAVPVHRLRRGQLESRRMPIAEAGAPPPLTVEADGEPLVIEVPPTHGLRLAVDVREDGRGEFRRLALPLISLPPGRYRVGQLPARTGFGTLVLRPVGGGEPVICPLEERQRPEVAR